MNEKELALYIELAPKLPWVPQVGDICYHPLHGIGRVTSTTEPMRFIDVGYLFKNKLYHNYIVYREEEQIGSLIWLPLPIDPNDPERIARGEKPRGLWGMVESDGKSLNAFSAGNCLFDLHFMSIGTVSYSAPTPTEALLLALREQWREK